MKRIATKDVKNVIVIENKVKDTIIKTAYRRIQNPTKKEVALGIARNFPISEIFYNQTGGKIYYNIYVPVKM